MYTISNDLLQVSIVDPVADRSLLGVRYATGGYIFQIDDTERGPLLSGPTYPDDFNWFDGQGIPDFFALGPVTALPGMSGDTVGAVDAPDPSTSLVIGVGICDLPARKVLEYCDWQVEAGTDEITMTTRHEFGPYAMTLERTVTLQGRTIHSDTRISNECSGQIRICWFPHPFYPLGDPQLCCLPGNIEVPEGTYGVDGSGWIERTEMPWSPAPAVPVSCDASGPFTILQRHPLLGIVSARFSFSPGHILIWGNDKTFSFEPYLDRTIGSQAALEWTVSYDF